MYYSATSWQYCTEGLKWLLNGASIFPVFIPSCHGWTNLARISLWKLTSIWVHSVYSLIKMDTFFCQCSIALGFNCFKNTGIAMNNLICNPFLFFSHEIFFFALFKYSIEPFTQTRNLYQLEGPVTELGALVMNV